MKAKNIVGFFIGAGLLYVLFKSVVTQLNDKVSFTNGIPSVTLKNGQFLIKIPISFTSELPYNFSFSSYDGQTFFEDVLIGNTSMLPFTLTKGVTSNTSIYIRVSPDFGRLIGKTINNPLTLLQIIQNGVRTKGRLKMRAGQKTISIPINEKIYFV